MCAVVSNFSNQNHTNSGVPNLKNWGVIFYVSQFGAFSMKEFFGSMLPTAYERLTLGIGGFLGWVWGFELLGSS